MPRCPTCPGTNRCVPADGPLDAEVFCIGERPGFDEDRGGVPFIGRAGREFNYNYLPLAGLQREWVYIDNTVSCRQDQNKTPTDKEIWGCAPYHIPQRLQLVGPKIVILMGATACKLIQQHGQERIDLEAEHGIPRRGKLWDWEGWVVPMYHPAGGLHDTAMMIPMLEDWELLRRWLEEGKWMWCVEDTSHRDYRLIETYQQLEDYFCDYLEEDGLAGGDTESHAKEPYSIQVSLKPGTGALLLWKNTMLVKALGTHLRSLRYTMALHNAPADLPMFEECWGGTFPYRDTMQEAYGLMLRQKLKVLSRRLLGRKRLSWEETVIPPSKRVLGQWLRDCLRYAEDNWQRVEERKHRTTGRALKPKVHESGSEKLLPKLYGFMVNNPDYKIWDKIDERMPKDELAKLRSLVGPTPQKGVKHLTMEELVEYGCSDADDTLTLALLFDRKRQEFVDGLNFQEEDRDR